MNYSISLISKIQDQLSSHLIRDDGQEDLCFALWYPSQGKNRTTALVSEVILPVKGDRNIHGNVSFNPSYLDRVLKIALEKKAGVVFLHSHPYPGWQFMSQQDETTEAKIAPSVKATTELSLVGMTIGSDGAWSGRFWNKIGPKKYQRFWCENVRVIGEHGLKVTFNDELLPIPVFREELKRTVSAWGDDAQQKLARLRFGIVGVGSVGSIVAETLARMGVQHIKLIDFDIIERHNLDRLLHATSSDIGKQKINVVGEALKKNSTAANFSVDEIPFSITEEEGFKEALGCDIIFSCVDRPWGRHVLNYIAYAYLIPVIDGGISIRAKNKMQGADWRMHAVFPGRRCLQCIGQYDSSFVNVERQGLLDDPTYIKNLPKGHMLKRNENVFCFSTHLASSLIFQMLSIVISPLEISNHGEQIYHFVTAEMESKKDLKCNDKCFVLDLVGKGDTAKLDVLGIHPAAEKVRSAIFSKKDQGFLRKIISWTTKYLKK